VIPRCSAISRIEVASYPFSAKSCSATTGIRSRVVVGAGCEVGAGRSLMATMIADLLTDR
jgi:hypothetical protein